MSKAKRAVVITAISIICAVLLWAGMSYIEYRRWRGGASKPLITLSKTVTDDKVTYNGLGVAFTVFFCGDERTGSEFLFLGAPVEGWES